MNIAFFHNLPPGGAKRVIYDQISHLSLNHQITLYQIKPPNNENDFIDFSQLNCRIITFPEKINDEIATQVSGMERVKRDINLFYRLPYVYKDLAQRIMRDKYDIVILHPDRLTQSPYLLRYLTSPTLYYCEEWLRIVYENGYKINNTLKFHKRIYEIVFRWQLKFADKSNTQFATKIVANSRFTSRNIEKAYKRKSQVIYPTVDTALFKPLNTRKIFDILFLGSKNAENGYNILQEANLILNNRLKIRVVSISKRKPLNDTELIKLYNSARIVVSLSIKEPFGLTIVEAMSCERPVIALKQGGYLETIEEGKTGYLVKSGEELANKINTLLKNQKLCIRLGIKGRESVIKNWSITKQGKILEKTLKINFTK